MTMHTDTPVVTRQDALDWMSGAMRNWAHVPRINDDDVEDVRAELQRFAQTSVKAATREKDTEIERLKQELAEETALRVGALSRMKRAEAERDQLRARLDEARRLLDALAQAESTYRYAHDILGTGDRKTGRAWDLMRRAGDDARAILASALQIEESGK